MHHGIMFLFSGGYQGRKDSRKRKGRTLYPARYRVKYPASHAAGPGGLCYIGYIISHFPNEHMFIIEIGAGRIPGRRYRAGLPEGKQEGAGSLFLP